jgi:hypothetical protein
MSAALTSQEAPVDWGVPPRIRWKFAELLDRERVTVNNLAVTIKDKVDVDVDRNALYRFARSAPERPDMKLVAAVLRGLELITHKQFTLQDLMEYDRDAEA